MSATDKAFEGQTGPLQKPVCALIGIGPGLGVAIARRFTREGYAVLGLARDTAKIAAEPGLTLWRADASDTGGLAAALHEGAGAARGQIDVLIYNAYRATMAASGPSSLDPDSVVEDFRVNVAGALAAVQAVLPDMRKAGRGTILLTGGGLALDPTGWRAAASLAIGKAGLRTLALTLHAELAAIGIHAATVTVDGQIQPGTAFDPDRIAGSFWALRADPSGKFRSKIVFNGMPVN
jgi:NAD(P)-dependent dehydrogenase (short-subunit alcohol dehydrogenase family)